MGVFDTTKKTIGNLVGITSKGQATKANSLPVVVASDQDVLATAANQTAAATLTGAVTETAPASDTASSGLNGRLQRIAQNITTLIGVLRGATGTYATPVSVTATATLIKASASSRKKLYVKNSSASAGAVYLGADATVTAGSAGKNLETLYAGDAWEEVAYTGALYAICDTGFTASVKYFEVTP